MTGPTVTCSACHAPVHSHCVARRMGCMARTSCANEMDFAFANHQAQQRMATSSAGFGRFMSAGGQCAGQAIGAVATGAAGGAARLATGSASGAVSATRGTREVADAMAEFSRTRAEMEALREENARLRGGSAAPAQGGHATPSSPERLAEEIAEAQDEGIDAVCGADWSQAGGPAASGAGDSAAEIHEVRAASVPANTSAEHVEEFSVKDSAQLLKPTPRLQDIQEVVILMVVVYLEALGRLEEASGVFLEVSHMAALDSEDVDWATQAGTPMESAAVASDYQVDLVAEVGGPKRDASLESTLAKMKAADLPHSAWKGSLAAKPGILEHGIQRASLDLGGTHHLVERHWSQVPGVVVETHETYLRHRPLDRPAIRPMQPAQLPLNEADAVNFHSVELRLPGLLLAPMPEDVKQDHALQQVSKGRHVDVTATYDELQRWKFSANRLATIGVAAPDPSVQLSPLKAIAHKMLESNEAQVDELWRYLSAEAREFADAVPQKAKAKAKAEKGKNGKLQDVKLCTFLSTPGGCSKGKQCTWHHPKLSPSVRNELLGLMQMGAGAPAGQADAEFWNASDPRAKMVTIKAKMMIANGERYLLAGTGATHELRGAKDFGDLGDDARTAQPETATGSHNARMVGDAVFVLGEHLQRLFSLASYAETTGLEMEWNPRRRGAHVGNDFVDLHRGNGSIYISEKTADILRAARRAHLREKFRASTAALAISLRTGDTGRMAQHFLLGTFSVATAADMQKRAHREGEAREAAGVPDDAPEMGAIGVSVDDDVGQLAARVAAASEVSELGELRLRSDRPGLMAAKPAHVPGHPQDEEGPAEAEVAPEIDGAGSEQAKTRHFVAPLENKRFETCKKGLGWILATIRSEFEGANAARRIHGDRASELAGTKSKEHFAKQGILVTSAPGREPNNNPRADKGIGLVKLRARAMLLSFPDPRDRQDLWPLAVQHAAWCSRSALE
ncbi:unnamed protein product [Prorocentrum cordatum]|uniref:C3H1-type domain-containing protein n=1 Tax=Prorocentrum cordatum TaxID=2364126 RepID=A0ABN9T730_9DINO|nr:unnamed protein product [Polarella glacialis]